MRYQISGKQIDIGSALQTHVESELSGILEKYAGRPTDAHVVFSKSGHEYVCEAVVHLSTGLTAQATGHANEIYAAFDGCSEKMDKQMRRYKRRLKDHQDGAISDLEGRAASHAAILAGMEAEVQRLRASNADLRDMTAQLRSAAADGATSPELINRATIAEIEALQAQRTSEAAEMDAIVSSLKPLIEEA